MRVRAVLLASTVLTATLLIRQADAGPVAVDSLDHLIASANVIVLGPFHASNVNGLMSVTIQASIVLKGSLAANSGIAVTWSKEAVSPPAYTTSPSFDGFGMFFLSSKVRGYSIVPVMIGDAEWPDVFIEASALRDDNFAAVEAPSSTVRDSVLGGLIRLVQAGTPIPFDLVDIYRQTHDSVLVHAFKLFRTDKDINAVALGVQGGLAAGDLPTLHYLRENSHLLSKASRWNSILQEVKVSFSNVGAEAVQTLGQIAVDETLDVPQREAAAAALARIHSVVSLPYLSKLLRSKDSFIQAMAVGGLASFANNVPVNSHEPAPGVWSYRTDATIAHSAFDESLIQSRPDFYLSFWQDWVLQNASITGQ